MEVKRRKIEKIFPYVRKKYSGNFLDMSITRCTNAEGLFDMALKTEPSFSSEVPYNFRAVIRPAIYSLTA
jgi:hypothetical protein